MSTNSQNPPSTTVKKDLVDMKFSLFSDYRHLLNDMEDIKKNVTSEKTMVEFLKSLKSMSGPIKVINLYDELGRQRTDYEFNLFGRFSFGYTLETKDLPGKYVAMLHSSLDLMFDRIKKEWDSYEKK